MDLINRLLNRPSSSAGRPQSRPSTPESGNDSPLPKTSEHEVKVRFAREFADVGSVTYSGPESLSSASSFHSLSSTLSTKSSSGICPDDNLPSVTVSQENADYSSVPTVSNLSSSAGSEAGEIIFSDSNAAPQTDDIGLNPSPRSLSPIVTGDRRGLLSSLDEKTLGDFELAEGSTDLAVRKSVKAQEPLPPEVLNLTDELLESLTNRLGGIQLEAEALKVQQSETENPANVQEYVPVEEPVHVEHPYIREYPSSVKSLFPAKEYLASIDSLFPEEERPSSIDHLFATNSVDGLSVVREHSPIQEQPSTLGLSVDREYFPAQDHPFVPSESECLHFEEHSSVQDHTSVPERLPAEEQYPVQEHSPIQEYSPVEHIPAQKHSSVEEQHPVEHISVQKHSPVQEHHPVEKHSPIREHTPIEHKSIREDSPIREHTPVVNSPIQKHSLIQEHPLVESIPVQEYPFAQGQPSDQAHPLLEEHTRIAETSKVTRNSDTLTEKQGSQFETVDLSLSFNGANCTRSFTETSLEPRVEREENFQVILDNRKADLSEETESVGIVKEDKGPLTTFSLDETITLDNASLNLAPAEKDQDKQFEPSQPENNIAPAAGVSNDQQSFEEFQLAAEGIANDIFKSSLELTEEATRFPDIPSEPAISECDINELFQDPECFDFLLTRGNSRNPERLRAESLYVKFDPLVANTSMLPQGNSQPITEEQNGKIEPPLVNSGTPKHNPAIAAIDRLLFYSPLPSGTECKAEKIQEKKEQPVPETKPDITPNVDINVSKELELVRATVLQLEEELQKQKKEYEDELARQKSGYQEKVSKLQTQLAQEVKNKNQMTVVVEEYEKSISRLVAERERDRTSLEHEKTKLQEELQAANHHLSNTEAAFNDVHQKYERIKGVVWAYKTNETVLKESIQENLETIKDLETRYDQLKNHAMNQLEKANSDLDVIRKQHDTERVKLHAMVRKAELKSNTLAGLVEQVTKENKELMQILDEVIARVGRTTVD